MGFQASLPIVDDQDHAFGEISPHAWDKDAEECSPSAMHLPSSLRTCVRAQSDNPNRMRTEKKACRSTAESAHLNCCRQTEWKTRVCSECWESGLIRRPCRSCRKLGGMDRIAAWWSPVPPTLVKVPSCFRLVAECTRRPLLCNFGTRRVVGKHGTVMGHRLHRFVPLTFPLTNSWSDLHRTAGRLTLAWPVCQGI